MNALSLDIAGLRAAYASGRLTPAALIEEIIRRTATDPNRVWIHRLADDALRAQAQKLAGRDPASLPLYGIPFAIKDNIDLAGVPTTAGCQEFAYTPQRNAFVVQRLIDAGAIPIGKTNLDQFATGLNGTRSPWGACRNAVLPEYISGGSSAGSSLAVALGVASFALGTDTAGSGRVPAALNNLVGAKPTRGLLSTAGVVPACRTLDCVTYFTASAREASVLLALTAARDPRDAYSRHNPSWNHGSAFGAPRPFRFGVPRPEALEFFGCAQGPALFAEAITHLEAIGGEAVAIDFSPFLQAARLLYEGPWVAERYAVAGDLIEHDPDAVLPVIRDVLAAAPQASAVEAFRARYRLQELKALCDAVLEPLDCVLTPTIGRPVTLAAMQAEPVLRNSELGYYTNFMNLLDYAAVAVPSAFMANGLPWGVTLFGRAFTDQYLLGIADAIQRHHGLPLAGNRAPMLTQPSQAAGNDRLRLVVCGAHLEGLPLNWQLTARGARLLERTVSSPHYRLYALAGGPPARPGMVRVASGGCSIDVEVWELPASELGSFVAGIAAPLGLGKLELGDGRRETGFICEPCGLEGARDISHFGGWRQFLASQRAEDRSSGATSDQLAKRG